MLVVSVVKVLSPLLVRLLFYKSGSTHAVYTLLWDRRWCNKVMSVGLS